MKTGRRLGIWMNHLSANLIEYSIDRIEKKVIESKFTHELKEQSLNKSENVILNEEQHQRSEYYKRLGDVIRNYENVILFGTTVAKVELFNRLKADPLFENINIEVRQVGKMTENQQYAFVREYFKEK